MVFHLNMRNIMNQDAEEAEPEKTTPKPDESASNPPTPIFEIKLLRFTDESGMQYDSSMLTLHVTGIDDEARIYFKERRWRFVIFDKDDKKISEIREGAKPFWESHKKRDEGIKQDLIEFGFCNEDEVENLLSKIKEKAKEKQALFVDQKNFVKVMESSREDIDEEEKMSSYAWANYVVSKLHIISDQKDMLYTYKGGLFTPDPNADQIFLCYRDAAQDDYRDGIASSIIRQIKAVKRTGYQDFNSDRNIVNFPNGLLNLITGELTPHTPNYVSTIQLLHPYIKNGKSEKIDKILEEILQLKDIKPLKEFVGYSMTTKINFKMAMMFVGDTNSGKSTIQDIITRTIGIKNISGIKLQELSTKFSLYSLQGKLLNMADELATKGLLENAAFKMLTGGTEWIDVEGKHIQSEMMMQISKLLFSANKVPESADYNDAAYYVRWKIITFLQHFDGKDKNTDTGILDSLTDDDYAQFGSECIELFMEVMKRDQFTGDAEEDEKILQGRLLSNPIKEFNLILEPDDAVHGDIKKQMMYEDAYVPWCKCHNITPEIYSEFGKLFKKMGWKEGHPGPKGNQIAKYMGVKMNEKWDEILGFTASLYAEETEVQRRMTEIYQREGGAC